MRSEAVGPPSDHCRVTQHLVRLQRRQHTVSRVVLRRFAWHDKITVYDRRSDAIYSKGPGGLFHERYDRHDPVTAEERWGRIETKMPRVYKLLDERRVLDDEDAVETLLDLMAMHWVRTPAMRMAHEQVRHTVVAASMRDLSTKPQLLASALKQQIGLVAAGQGELDWYNARLHQNVFTGQGEKIFSDRVGENYEKVRAILARSRLQIGYADRMDFIIGDAPVVTLKRDHDGVGPHQGVAVGDASEICMPISPRILIGLGPTPKEVTLDSEIVIRYNSLQVRGFIRLLGCQPGGPSDLAMRRHLPARSIRP